MRRSQQSKELMARTSGLFTLSSLREKMKIVLTFALLASAVFASPTLAADQESVAAAESACGPGNIKFDVKTEKNTHPTAQTQAGKALVYIVEVFEKPGNQLGKPTVKVGLDDTWVGANKCNSYFFFSVEPGDHHL